MLHYRAGPLFFLCRISVNMRTVAAFDLGVRNFAICVIAVQATRPCRSYGDALAASLDSTTQLVLWQNVDVEASPGVGGAVAAVVQECRKQWEVIGAADVVVVEQQVVRNTTMKCAAHAIQGLFVFHGVPVIMMPPRQKFRPFVGWQRMDGKERSAHLKHIAVKLCTRWASEHTGKPRPAAAQSLALFRHEGVSGVKLDDMADALLQAVCGIFTALRPPRAAVYI
jgi:hypothetical protein